MGKRYKTIVKADKETFLKYHVDDLLSFVRFLDTKWQGWRWFNVYDGKTGEQLASFTVNRRPSSKQLA